MSERRPATFDHLKSAKKPLQRKIRIFLDDDTVTALAEAQNALETAIQQARPNGLEDDVRADLIAAIDTAQEAVEQSSVEMTFRSIGRKGYDRLVLAYPASEETNKEHQEQYGTDAPYEADEFSVALIAASCIEPRMTEDEVRELRDTWNTAEYVELFTTALEVNTQRRVADLGKAYG